MQIDFNQLTYQRRTEKKEKFYIWDFGKSDQQLIDEFNPKDEVQETKQSVLKRGIAKGVQMAILDLLKEAEIVDLKYDKVLDGTIIMEREGVEVRGYIDAVTAKTAPLSVPAGVPICIRTIFDLEALEGKPDAKYVGQLAMMMDFLNKDQGVLIVADSKGDQQITFLCEKISPGMYGCGELKINITEQYKRFSKINK